MRQVLCAGLLAVLGCSIAASPAPAETRLAMDIGGATVSRVVAGETEWVYQWPAVYFESHFRGDRVTLRMDDASNELNVLVDGKELMVLKRPGETVVALQHLGAGEHTIRLEKRTETQTSTGAFGGFYVDNKEDVLPAAARARRILFLGDSLTAGYGNRSAFSKCSTEELFESTDTNAAFGPLVAKHFDADYDVRAYSGLGLVRNYGGVDAPQYHLPNLWRRTIFADPQPDMRPWTPQVLVIGIGGNDFSTQVHAGEKWKSQDEMAAEYAKTYVSFLKELRRTYPHALIVMTWTADFSPLYTQTAEIVYTQAQAAGIGNMDHLVFPKMERTGCSGHPNIRDDAHVAELLESVIAQHAEAWQGH
jgi:lysophospholipase L1-like esterase